MKIDPANYPVYIVGGDGLIQRMYEQAGFPITSELEDAKIVQFTGGADVDPSLYGHPKHPLTSSNLERDKKEMEAYDNAPKGALKVGICRGAQFLCVMNGGSLYQDVDNHAIHGTHPVLYINEDGNVVAGEVTSTHHQMMCPGVGASEWIIAALSTHRDIGDSIRRKVYPNEGPDKECVFWRGTNSLGFQGHPEYESKKCRELFFTVLERALALKVAPSRSRPQPKAIPRIDDIENNIDDEDDF